MSETYLVVRHNIEMAHRLWKLPGKCTQIHGHSWWAEVTLVMDPDEDGVTVDFSEVKKILRGHLDGEFDHRLALDMDDPLVRDCPGRVEDIYPGHVLVPGMPTVENMAKWIGEFMQEQYPQAKSVKVHLWEAATNAAGWCNA